MRDPSIRNLTRFTPEKTSFAGWRLCICRSGMMFTKYFADRGYGSEEKSKAAAVALRDEILGRLETGSSRAVLSEFLSKYAKAQKKRARRRKRRSRRLNAAKNSPSFLLPDSEG